MANRNEGAAAKKKRKKRGPVGRILLTILLVGVITAAMLACMAALYIKIVIVPGAQTQIEQMANLDNLNLTTTVYYKDPTTGQLVEMQKLHGTENRIWVPYEDIPKNLINAAIAIEDRRFPKHNGVDWIRTARGTLSLFTGQKIEGGSTITQQLIKNVTSENQVTIKRKVKEIFSALEFEKQYTKEKIMEMYLNYIFMGEGCNGVYTASYAYFGKHVSELSLAECASLIGITNNPSLYNPYRKMTVELPDKTEMDANKFRQTLILQAMLKEEMISQAEYDEAIAAPLVLARSEDEVRKMTVYSWYIDTVIQEVIDDLQTTYNYSEKVAANLVYSGGLQIETNMNLQVQNAVDAIYLDRGNLNYTSPSGQPIQSAITVVDNRTGGVVAIAGAMGEKTQSRVLNRAQSKRQPGSSMKPLAVYAPALELDFITPNSIVADAPDEKGWPKNATGTYEGKMTIARALKVSSNAVAVNVLEDYVTPQVSFDFLRDRFHFEGDEALVESRTKNGKVYSDVTLSLGLGGLTDGVSTWQMAAAFSVFPREGVYYEPSTYSRVLNNKGDVLLERNTAGEVALKQKTTYYMNEMLKDVVSVGDGATGGSARFAGQTIAGKTGTTSDIMDLYFVGYTNYYTAAVWVGYDRLEKMNNVRGSAATTLWKQVMEKSHVGLADEPFPSPSPEQLVSTPYCRSTGLLAGPYCPTSRIDLFKEDVPKNCGVHRAPVAPPSFDINNPSTHPTEDPNFKPEDPSTWPGAGGGDSTNTPPPETETTPVEPAA